MRLLHFIMCMMNVPHKSRSRLLSYFNSQLCRILWPCFLHSYKIKYGLGTRLLQEMSLHFLQLLSQKFENHGGIIKTGCGGDTPGDVTA